MKGTLLILSLQDFIFFARGRGAKALPHSLNKKELWFITSQVKTGDTKGSLSVISNKCYLNHHKITLCFVADKKLIFYRLKNYYPKTLRNYSQAFMYTTN
jgi:hypothetical protein